jgi:predicted RNA-binding Zn-ribbon protein involved in translation (DUF1610 family)
MIEQTFLPGYGAIAQLGERIVRNDEVVGSIPTSSTNFQSLTRPHNQILFRSVPKTELGGEFASTLLHEKIARVPSRKKIDLDKVMASLVTSCPKCGHQITPAEIKRVSSEEMECPACGSRFKAGQ